MLELLILLLIIFWFLGYVSIPALSLIPNPVLFVFNGESITFFNLIILLLIVWAIGVLPSPLRQITGFLLILWILSILGIIAISNFSSIVVWAVILGLIFSLFNNRKHY